MNSEQPTREEWRRLYELAGEVKKLAPWEWMDEKDVFGVQNPESGELGFVSIMGMLGEHLAVALYLGAEGLYSLWAMEEAGPSLSPDLILETPQLQASFEDRSVLAKEDREIIKSLGLKFRGRQAWPMFRSYGPGLWPWFVNSTEARFLSYALEQVLEVTPRVRDDPGLLATDDEEEYLVRVPREEQGHLIWEDQILHISPPPPKTVEFLMDEQILAALKRLRPGQTEIETDLFVFPAPVGPPGVRPQYGYVLMLVDSHTGMILGLELLNVETTLEAMWARVPLTVARLLARAGILPKAFRVRSPLVYELLGPLAEELPSELEMAAELPYLEMAKQALMEQML